MVSGIVASSLMVLFLGGWLWVWAPARRAEFDAAALLALENPQEHGDDC